MKIGWKKSQNIASLAPTKWFWHNNIFVQFAAEASKKAQQQQSILLQEKHVISMI
jgi:hypothetical protein